jgi:hypothetical protein
VLGTAARRAVMPMDAWRDGEQFIVEFDLPGVKPDFLGMDVERDVLIVPAERTSTKAARWSPPNGPAVPLATILIIFVLISGPLLYTRSHTAHSTSTSSAASTPTRGWTRNRRTPFASCFGSVSAMSTRLPALSRAATVVKPWRCAVIMCSDGLRVARFNREVRQRLRRRRRSVAQSSGFCSAADRVSVPAPST